MAAESNTGYYFEQTFASPLNRHAISFQSSAMDNSSEMIMMGSYYGTNGSGGVMFSGNSYNDQGSSCVTQVTNSSSSLLLDSVSSLKHDAGFDVEWSVEEQYRLEEGLVKYADDPSIMRYIEIAAMLRDKTVRDVALRCRWMTGKRRKQNKYNFGKKVTDKKDKFTESVSKVNTFSVSPLQVAGYSVTRNHQNRTGFIAGEAKIGAKNLMEQNNEAFGRISANLSSKCCNAVLLQDNIDLFYRTRNNITTILNNMSNMPGIMSRMPALPLSINDELANSILPGMSQFYTKITKMESKGSANRIRRCACELMSLGDDLMDDHESWDFVGRDLQLKATFLYCDFNKVISSAPEDQKRSLTELANRLFCSIEELDLAVKVQSIQHAQHRFSDLALVLEEVVETDLMPPLMPSSDLIIDG